MSVLVLVIAIGVLNEQEAGTNMQYKHCSVPACTGRFTYRSNLRKIYIRGDLRKTRGVKGLAYCRASAASEKILGGQPLFESVL